MFACKLESGLRSFARKIFVCMSRRSNSCNFDDI